HVWQLGARSVGRHRSGEAVAFEHDRPAQGHAQELVGVRYRHRVARFRRRGLAHSTHDAGLRPFGPGAPALHSELRPRRTTTWGEWDRAGRIARADFRWTRAKPH